MNIHNTSHIVRNRHARLVIPLVGVDLVFFAVTNPGQGQLVVIVAGAVLLLATLYAVSWWLAHTLSRIRLVPKDHQQLVCLLVAGVSSYVVFMQSIGELNLRDIIALLPLVAMLYFYLTYSRKAPDTR